MKHEVTGMESVKEIVQSNLANPKLRAETMEKVLLKGDLGSLTPSERLHSLQHGLYVGGIECGHPAVQLFDLERQVGPVRE